MNDLNSLESFLEALQQRDANQPEYLQAVREVFTSLWPFLEQNPHYREQSLLERLVEPERVIQFRVAWTDDQGKVQVNRAWRVQFSSAIGPFKGGCASTHQSTYQFSNSSVLNKHSKMP